VGGGGGGGGLSVNDHYLVVAKLRDRLSVIKRGAYKCHMQRFRIENLSDVEVREQNRFKISNSLAALETYMIAGT